MCKQTQTMLIRHDPSYKQLEIKTNQTSFYLSKVITSLSFIYQVIRLHRPCQQLRALGMLSRDGKRLRDEFLSIPVDGIYTFAVVKDSKTGIEFSHYSCICSSTNLITVVSFILVCITQKK